MGKIILVGGGSSSGKTFITTHVCNTIGKDLVTKISLDDYYIDQSDKPMIERAKVNYDHPKAFDWKLLREQIKLLKEGQSIEKPIYNFENHTRGLKTEIVKPTKIIFVEGIMALVDKQLRELGDLKIFIQAKPEIRFLRRLGRDSKERGRNYESIVNQYIATVAPMYEEIVGPSSNYADLIINNDDRENHAIDVLTSLIKFELEQD